MRVLLCDDHALFVAALADYLTGRGHQVVGSVGSPVDVAPAVVSHAPDAVVLDLRFRDGSGLDAARAVRALGLGTRIVLCTGHVDARARDAAAHRVVDLVVDKGRPAHEVERALTDLSPVAPRAVRPGCAPPDPLAGLTPRERQVLTLLADGHSTQTVARELGISVQTVHAHVKRILRRLGVTSRFRAVHVYLAAQQPVPQAGASEVRGGRRGA